MSLEVSLKEALTGFERQVLFLDDTSIILNVSTIVNPYTDHVINAYGFTSEGSLVIKFNVLFPKELSEDTKKMLKECL